MKLAFHFGWGLALSANPDFGGILVGSDEGLTALERKTGRVLWRTEMLLGTNGPACTAGLVVAGSADGKVYACDLETGKVRWTHDYFGDAPTDPPGFDGARARFEGRPARPRGTAVDGQLAVVTIFDQCRVLALDVTTGERRWAFQTQGWMGSRPAIGPRFVIAASQDGHFYAIDKKSGKLGWRVRTRGRNSAPAATTPRFTYLSSCDARVYAVDQGRVAWSFATEHKPGQGAPIYSPPLVVGDTLYQATMRGKIYALDRRTGKLRWTLHPLPRSELIGDLATDGKRLFISSRKGLLGNGESAVIAVPLGHPKGGAEAQEVRKARPGPSTRRRAPEQTE